MSKKEKNGAATAELGPVLLRPSQIIDRPEWNARKEKTSPESKEEQIERGATAEHDEGTWPDHELDRSIRARGLIQPLRVGPRLAFDTLPSNLQPGVTEAQLAEGLYPLYCGSRRRLSWMRVKGDEPLPVTIAPSTGSAEEDDRIAMLENAIENIQRENLRPWEMADHFHKLSKVHGMKPKAIAEEVGLSSTYVANLIRVRAKLCPDLWETFVQSGEGIVASMRLNDLVKVCTEPHAEQLAAYNGIERDRRGGRPKGRKASGATSEVDEGGEASEETEPRANLDAWRRAAGEEYARLLNKTGSGGALNFLNGFVQALDVVSGKDFSGKSPTWGIRQALRTELVEEP